VNGFTSCCPELPFSTFQAYYPAGDFMTMHLLEMRSPAVDSFMDGLLEQAVFSVGKQQYLWGDVILAARLWGDWADLERQLVVGLACIKRWQKTEDELDGEELRAAANEFRYTHDLVSAKEAENWLIGWGLSAEDWMEYLRRLLLRRKWADQLGQIIESYPITQEEMQANLRAEAVCSDQMANFARRLAAHAAAHAKAVEEGWVEPADNPTERSDRLRALESGYRLFCERAVETRAIRTQIDAHRLDWIRIDCRYVLFPDEQVAREAFVCLREDGADLEAIAARSHGALRERSLYLDQIDGSLRDRFLSAEQGALIGPVPWRGASAVFFIKEKTLPAINDVEIHKRAQAAVLDMALNREINNRVRWHAGL
jgi:hypothetical protein